MKISAVVACYRDAQAVPLMYERLVSTITGLGADVEIVFVNDASPDNARDVLAGLAAQDRRVVVINHSRPFGSQSAFTSGMRVASGDAVVAPRVTRRLLSTYAHRLPAPGRPDAGQRERLTLLTAREQEVLLEVARSLSNAEIAERLVLSEATVKSHVGRILSKLELRDRVQIVVFAYETGLVTPSQE